MVPVKQWSSFAQAPWPGPTPRRYVRPAIDDRDGQRCRVPERHQRPAWQRPMGDADDVLVSFWPHAMPLP